MRHCRKSGLVVWGVVCLFQEVFVIYIDILIYIYTCVYNIYIYTNYICMCALMLGRCVVTCLCRCADIVISRLKSLKHLNI